MSKLKYIASVSFGKDSLAMLLMLLEKNCLLDEVIFYDTGAEFNSIYRIRDKVIPLLEERGITFTELKSEYSFEFWMFDKEVKNRGKEGFHYGYSWCGNRCRWGTALKRDAFQKYLKGMDYKQYLGIAADETKRIERNTKEINILPLVEWGITEKECLDYCHNKGFFWIEDNGLEIYDYFSRTSCFCCANKNLQDLRNMRQCFPEYWNKLEEYQRRTSRPFKADASIFDLDARFQLEEEWVSKGKSIRSKAFYTELKEVKKP